MYFAKAHKIEKLASTDYARHPALTAPYLDLKDAASPMLVATDGHALVALSVTTEDGDTEGAIPVEAIKQARKCGAIGTPTIAANGACVLPNGVSIPRESVEFPNWRQLVPKAASDLRIILNAELLKRIADALGSDTVELRFGTTPTADVIQVRAHDASIGFGLLMPARF